MKSISYAWTTGAVKARKKICTRRKWSADYAARFHAGEKVLALNRNYRIGGSPFGMVQLTADPKQERTGTMTEQDFIDEGLAWMEAQGIMIQGKTPRQFFDDWKALDEAVYKIEFEILEIY
jgi:hypothetical protein